MNVLRDRNLALVGTVSLLLALGVAFVPSVAVLLRPLAGLTGTGTLLLFGAVAGLLGLWSFKQGVGDNADADLWTPQKMPERAYYDEHRTAGADVDTVLEDEEIQSGPRTDARSRIRQTAVSVVANAENCSNGEANGRLNDGSWTDDPRAAAFFANRGVTTVPLRTRIRDWASGEAFQRQARHAVSELERLASGDIESHRRPQHSGLFADDAEDDELAGSADTTESSPVAGDDSARDSDDPVSTGDDSPVSGESSDLESESELDERFLTPEMRAVQSEGVSQQSSSSDEPPAENDHETPTQPLADELEGTR